MAILHMLRQLSRFVTMVAAAIIAVGILVSLLLFDRFIVSEAPEGKALKTLTIRIDEVERKDGLKQVLIGRKELMHPPGALSAVERHVRITQRDGEWHLGNASTSRRLFLIFEDRKTGKRFETAARRMPLEVGDRIERFEGAVEIYDVKRSNGRAETVDLAVAQRAGLRGFSKRLSYYRLSLSPSHRGLVAPMVKGPDGALIRAEGKRLPAGWVGKCRERSPFSETVSRFTQWSVGLIARNEWARKLVGATSEQTALRFGGVLSCEGGVETPRIAITDLAPGGIQISARDGVLFWATDDAAAFATVKRKAAAGFAPPAAALTPGGEGCKAIERFSDIEWPLQLDGKSAGPDRGCVAAPSGWTGQLSRVIIGRTQYKVSVSGDKGVLTLTADTNRPVFFDSAIEVDPKDLPKGVAAVATPVSTKGDAPGPLRFLLTKTPLPVIALMGVALFGVLYFLFDSRVEPGAATMRSGARVQRRVLAAGLGALSFLVALVGVYYLRPGLIRLTTLGLVPTPEASPPYAAAELWILNLGLASLAALFAARGSWRAYAYWGAVMLIVGAGMVNFAQLAAGADNTRYSDEYSKFVLAATMAAPALTFAWLVPLSKVRWLIGVFLTPPAGQRPTRADAAQQGLRLSWRVGFELALLGAVAVCFAAAGFFALFGIGLHLGLPTLPMFAGESATALYSAAALFGIIGVGVYKAPTLGLSWRMAPLGGLIVIFLAWFGFGGEEGLAAIQPAELGKLAAIIFIAVALVAIQRRRESLTPVLPIGVFFGYMAALVLFGALFVVIPTLKSDYSPVLIIGLSTVTVLLAAGASSILALLVGPTALRLLGGLARRVRMGPRPFAAPTTLPDYFAPRIAGGQKNVWVARLAGLIAPILRISATAIALLIILFALLRVWQPYFASEYEEARTKLEPYIVSDGVAVLAKRALSYRDLAYVRWEEAKSKTPPAEENLVDYEDLGLQVIRSRLAMATAPCTAFGRNLLWGCDEKSASAPLLGANPPSVMRIPAVEDDFAAAFYVSRFGVEASVGLAIAQAALIALLFLFAARLRRLTPGDRREDTIRQLMANLTIGAGALFALHWFISWSNIFGLLPVMGQPMTFMSLGTSHHIFMAYPLIMIGILAARFAESAPDEELKLFEPPQLGPQSMVRR